MLSSCTHVGILPWKTPLKITILRLSDSTAVPGRWGCSFSPTCQKLGTCASGRQSVLQSSHFGIVPVTGACLGFLTGNWNSVFWGKWKSYHALISEGVSIPALGEKRHFGSEAAIVYCTWRVLYLKEERFIERTEQWVVRFFLYAENG